MMSAGEWLIYIILNSATLKHIFTCPLAGGPNHLRQTANRVRGSSRRTAALQQHKHVVGQQRTPKTAKHTSAPEGPSTAEFAFEGGTETL